MPITSSGRQNWSSASLRRSTRARRELADQIDQICFAQFLLFRQGERLKAHAHRKGVGVDRRLALFRLSRLERRVGQSRSCFSWTNTAGRALLPACLPTISAPQGQLWGNPVYDWDAHRQTGLSDGHIARLRSLLAHVDVIRLDHFRGFAAAWHVPAGAPTAQSGKWVPGPGAEFLRAVEKELGVAAVHR